MPITPFHLGPGILIKAVLQGYFSLIIFGWAQVLMDLQPLIAVVTGRGSLHGFSHTYPGAALIALIAAVTGRWIYRWCMAFVERDFTPYQRALFEVPAPLSTGVCIGSAYLGTLSHVLLDSIMHADLEPFYPLAIENRLLLVVSIDALYRLCACAGLIGALLYVGMRRLRVKRTTAQTAGRAGKQVMAGFEDAVQPAHERLPAGAGQDHCEQCGQSIAAARRKTVPGVRLCVACQSERDRHQAAPTGYHRRGSKDSQLR